MKRCIEWQRCRSSVGYGEFRRDGKLIRAHREMYEAWYGPIPKGMYVCHTCDNRACINPHHLFLGTALDNMRDMIAKGRDKHPPMAGRNNHKLTEYEVRVIRGSRRMGCKSSWLAKYYGISPVTVRAIVTGRIWKHIDE